MSNVLFISMNLTNKRTNNQYMTINHALNPQKNKRDLLADPRKKA